ncbi:MAG: c-type cytochrome domain-containing protein, partial [Verrucomicrobiota bacterium]
MENYLVGGLMAAICFTSATTLKAAPKVDFEKQVFPILKEHCLDCHQAPVEVRGRAKKPKGGLRLDGARWIMRGGSGGEAIFKGKPEKSPLLQRVVLPPDDEDIMPPKGKPLSKKQAALIEQWIAEGARFGGWKGNET